jgi:uncharacterized protein (TIGR02118 family)
MVKLIALYKKPADLAEFEKHYFDVHLPLIKKAPGLRKIEVTKINGSPFGDAQYAYMAEMYYDSLEDMNASNASAEGKAAAKDLMGFAAKIVTLFFGEVKE